MARTVGKLPENTSIIMPRLVCRDPAAEIDFCVRAFEAVEINRRPGPDGSVAHALLSIGGEMIMIEAEWPTLPSRAPAADGTSPVVIFLYVPDVDGTVARALGCGGKVLVPLQDQFWGDRIAWLMDPAGHVWTVATRIEQTTAEQRTQRWEQIRAARAVCRLMHTRSGGNVRDVGGVAWTPTPWTFASGSARRATRPWTRDKKWPSGLA